MPDGLLGHPICSIIEGIQLETGHDLKDHFLLHHASMPEHEALHSSLKICLNTVAVTFICSGSGA